MVAGTGSRVFINEIHYDNGTGPSGGNDLNEYLEIANPTGMDLTGWTIVLYNGNGGGTYGSPIALSGSATFIGVNFPSNGLQNGNADGTQADGFALVDPDGNVVQFLSYEGEILATNGPAVGLTSTNIGVAENSSTDASQSLQLQGEGWTYGDFTWVANVEQTQDGVNTDQSFVAPFVPEVIFTQNFDDFRAQGLAPEPLAGQLDSDVYRIIGMSTGNTVFGETYAGASDYGRGADENGGVGTGGVYAINSTAEPDDYNFTFQPGGDDVTPGSLDILITNSGSATNSFTISYDIEYLNDQPRANSLNLLVSTDGGITFTQFEGFNFVTPELASGSGTAARSGTITLNATIGNGETFILRFATDDVSGAGSRDEIGIDNISVATAEPVEAQPGVLAIDNVSLLEGDEGLTSYTFTITRSGGADGTVSVDYNVIAGLDSTLAETEIDGPFSGTVTFLDGETSKTITINVVADTIIEADEQFRVVLSNPQGGVAIDTEADVGTGTVLDDDNPGAFSIDDVMQAEGDDGITLFTFTVSRDGSAGEVGVQWSIETGGPNSIDVDDVVSLEGGFLTFADGVTTQTITVEVKGDTTIERDEIITVRLESESGGATIADATGIGTIVDDDAPVSPIASVFINEIHYDDAGGDSGEGIEIAGPAGTDLAGWQIVLYNGNGGGAYDTVNLSGVIPDQDDGFGTLAFLIPGIQNGSPDGMALVDPLGNVIQFLSYEGTLTATDGPAAGMTSEDIGVAEAGEVDGNSLQLIGSGSFYQQFIWQVPSAQSFGNVNVGQDFAAANPAGTLFIQDASVVEGDEGSAAMTFVIFREGGTSGELVLSLDLSFTGSADASDIDSFTTGVTFAEGQTFATVTVRAEGDLEPEPGETFNYVITSVTGGAAIGDGVAIGTILNDDKLILTIPEIQGASHVTPYLGQEVTTTGIVTATASNGYYLQDATGDGDSATSDGIFVFVGTGNVTVAVGDEVTVTGTASEFDPGGEVGLSITQISSVVEQTVLSSGNALPMAVLIGPDGIAPPTENIEDDDFTSFDPATDGIDFWESLEGMLVTVQAPQVVQATNGFGEVWTAASDGSGNLLATNVSSNGTLVIDGDEGGVGYFNSVGAGADFNPERIQFDNGLNGIGEAVPEGAQVGDVFNDVTGIVSYAFNNYEILATEAITYASFSDVSRETTMLSGSGLYMTVATYNVLNLDINDADGDTDVADGRFTQIARDIGFALRAPDVVVLEEVQDDSGSANDGTITAEVTLQTLVDTIFAETGVRYGWIDTPLTAENATGGEPGGNIRVAMLYRLDRVDHDPDSVFTITGGALDGSRPVLGAEFTFNGETVTVLGAHLTAKGGSTSSFGEIQPGINNGEARRLEQNQLIKDYVDTLLAADPDANVIVTGDFNEFQFEEAMQVYDGSLFNTTYLLAPEERYSIFFEGNAQQLDHILVSDALQQSVQVDVVHINTIVEGGASDHDPVVARLFVSNGAIIEGGKGTAGSDLILGTAGRDILLGNGGNDEMFGYDGNDILYGGTGSDLLDGGAGNDYLLGDDNRDGPGNDILLGGAGNDYLSGGQGNDILDGGSGNDVLVGGLGADRFVLDGSVSGSDYIVDLNVGEGDRIEIVNAGTLTFTQLSYAIIISNENGEIATIVRSDLATVQSSIVLVGGGAATVRATETLHSIDEAPRVDMMIMPDSHYFF